MTKVLVLGAGGMLGHVVREYLISFDNYHVVGLARKAINEDTEVLDVLQFDRLEQVIDNIRPDIIINCIGILVQGSENAIDNAILLNSYLPHLLAKLGYKYKFKLIHISTDCVFSGRAGAYKDTDFRDGDTPYARTKALGEVIDDCNLTIRTSIIGPELKEDGTGLFHWFMKQTGTVFGYSEAYWSGVTTIELAKFIKVAIENKLTGIYQLSAPEKISKFEILKLFKDIWKKNDIEIKVNDKYFCDKSMINTENALEYPLKSYPEMFLEMKEWISKRDYQY